MRKINLELLSQFASQGLIINEGITISTCLVQSSSHPIIKDTLKEEKRETKISRGKTD